MRPFFPLLYGFTSSIWSNSMGAVNLVVIVESVRVILTHSGGDTNEFHLASILAVAAALGS